VGCKVKLQQAYILLSEARVMLNHADWSERKVGRKGNILFEKVIVVRVAGRMKRRHLVPWDCDLGRMHP
jgi:hypothetical protein